LILVDTTVWIDFFAGTTGMHVDILEHAINNNQNICICGVILTEILQGIHDDKEYNKTKSYLEQLLYLPMGHTIFIQSAEIYRSLRKKGFTIRKPIDCMIAAVSIAYNIPLLHNDRDFEFIEKHAFLKTLKEK
jgi:predicted nucleic acid-binding protein